MNSFLTFGRLIWLSSPVDNLNDRSDLPEDPMCMTCLTTSTYVYLQTHEYSTTWAAFYKSTYDLQPNERMLINNKLISVSI